MRVVETCRPRTSTETTPVSDEKQEPGGLGLTYTRELENGLSIIIKENGRVTISNFDLARGDSVIVRHQFDNPREQLQTPLRTLKNFLRLPAKETYNLQTSDILRVRTQTQDKDITLTISN